MVPVSVVSIMMDGLRTNSALVDLTMSGTGGNILAFSA
jgi:hypothetical protein